MKIKTLFNQYKIFILLVLVIALAVSGYAYYRSTSNKLLDIDNFNSFRDSLNDLEETEAGGFASQDELKEFIKSWADERSLEYVEDKAGNIIFDKPAVKRKKNAAPTMVAVSMNYETATDNASMLASAASIASSDVDSGRRTVIFFNDEKNLGKGYKHLNKKYIKGKPKVIYMDQGSSFYLSTSSFREVLSEAIVPAEREESTLDTAVRVKITGIESNEINSGISKQPDPISAVSSLLTRLKSKSAICRLADINVESNGNMYPTGIEATFTMNSYAVGSFTSFIEKRIKAWNKSYGDDHENLEFTYEVIDDPDALPKKVYSAETTDALTSVLYTAKTGTYRYGEGDPIPEGKEANDLYGINCATDITAGKDSIKVSFVTQGYNEMFTSRIIYDNTAAAELYGCDYKVNTVYDEFLNERDSLSRTFEDTYKKVNSKITPKSTLKVLSDNYFTPCSYLAAKNENADIIHLRINPANASNIANTVLCYIKAKGNTSIFN